MAAREREIFCKNLVVINVGSEVSVTCHVSEGTRGQMCVQRQSGNDTELAHSRFVKYLGGNMGKAPKNRAFRRGNAINLCSNSLHSC